jgi:hypothetical protein
MGDIVVAVKVKIVGVGHRATMTDRHEYIEL